MSPKTHRDLLISASYQNIDVKNKERGKIIVKLLEKPGKDDKNANQITQLLVLGF